MRTLLRRLRAWWTRRAEQRALRDGNRAIVADMQASTARCRALAAANRTPVVIDVAALRASRNVFRPTHIEKN